MPDQTQTLGAPVGLLLASGAIPRIVAGPVLIVIKAATAILVRARVTRQLLVTAMLLDPVRLGMSRWT